MLDGMGFFFCSYILKGVLMKGSFNQNIVREENESAESFSLRRLEEMIDEILLLEDILDGGGEGVVFGLDLS